MSTECSAGVRVISCLLIAAAAETLLWIRVIVSMLAMEATPLPSSDNCKHGEDIDISRIWIHRQILDVKTDKIQLSQQKLNHKKKFQKFLVSIMSSVLS